MKSVPRSVNLALAGLFKQPLTCHVQDGVGLSKVLLQRFDRFGRRQYIQVDLALLSFALHFFHDWQRPSASADYQSPAFPGYFLFDRERCVSKFVTKLLGRLFLAFADLPSIDYNVMLVGRPVNTDRTKREIFEPHGYFRTLELVRPSFAHNSIPEKEISALIAWNQTGSGFQVPSYGSTVRRLYEGCVPSAIRLMLKRLAPRPN